MQRFQRYDDHGWFKVGQVEVTTSVLLAASSLIFMVLGVIAAAIFRDPLFYDATLVREGEVWRVVTWPLSNGVSIWLLLSAAMMYLIGGDIERELGRRRFAWLIGSLLVLPAVLTVGRRLLTRLGYQPVAFPNAAEAWAAFQAEPDHFAAVLSDLSMPGLTGIEFAARVRWLRPQTPFILTSGFTGNLTEENLADHGVTAVMQKPLDYETLAATLHQVLNPKA